MGLNIQRFEKTVYDLSLHAKEGICGLRKAIDK